MSKEAITVRRGKVRRKSELSVLESQGKVAVVRAGKHSRQEWV